MPRRVVRRKRVGKGLLSSLIGTPASLLASIGLGKMRRVGRPRRTRKHRGAGIGDLLGDLGRGLGGGVGGGINKLLGSLFGGKRKIKRKRVGRGILSDLNELAKDTKLISKGLDKFKINPFGIKGVAETLGYGGRRKAGRPRRRKVGGYVPANYYRLQGMGGGNLHL